MAGTPSGSRSPLSSQPSDAHLSQDQRLESVKRHLLSSTEQARLSSSSVPTVATLSADEEEYPTPYASQGGDIVAPIYKWVAQQEQQSSASSSAAGTPSGAAGGQEGGRRVASGASGLGGGRSTPNLRRSKSLVSIDRSSVADESAVTPGLENESTMSVREILEPGGFRRDFLTRSSPYGAGTPGSDDPRERSVSPRRANTWPAQRVPQPYRPPPSPFTRSFVDFLSLYGHFGGEDLEESDDDLLEDIPEEDEEAAIDGLPPTERTPLFAQQQAAGGVRHRNIPSQSSRKGRSRAGTARGISEQDDASKLASASSQGDATVGQAVMMLLKSFVGTGVLFLGKAFYNGGILFSTIVLITIALTSLYSFLLLVQTRLIVHGSFGDIGGVLYGKGMRYAILFSIVLSQIGFVAAYTIFVAENLQAFFMAVTGCRAYVAIGTLILAQLVLFLPLAMIRNIQKLSGTALVADAFILLGLVYIFSYEIKTLKVSGLADVKLFNSQDFPLLIGTAVFSFEGIGLVIPITESMAEPHKFPKVLSGVMVGVMVLFAGAGVLAYAAYGSDIQTVVFVNLPQDDKFVNAAQFLYSIAILLSTPLQLFPAVRIMENGLFSRSGKFSTKVKWEKNVFRAACVVGCSVIAWLGASDLDKFVSLIGSVACVPLCFCYPAMLHYKACASTRKQKAADIALFIFGVVAALYTTSQTIKLLVSGKSGGSPHFGNCPPPEF